MEVGRRMASETRVCPEAMCMTAGFPGKALEYSDEPPGVLFCAAELLASGIPSGRLR